MDNVSTGSTLESAILMAYEGCPKPSVVGAGADKKTEVKEGPDFFQPIDFQDIHWTNMSKAEADAMIQVVVRLANKALVSRTKLSPFVYLTMNSPAKLSLDPFDGHTHRARLVMTEKVEKAPKVTTDEIVEVLTAFENLIKKIKTHGVDM